MKTIIQLLIVCLLLYATFQVGRSSWRFYSLKDAIHSEALHGGRATTSELHKRILEIAEEYGVALDSNDVQVGRDGDETAVTVSYVEEIPITPFYNYPWTFDASTTVRPIKPLRIDDIR